MVSNKKRLYLALYPSGGTSGCEELKYHLAFLIGPKNEDREAVPGMRYHVKNPPGGNWLYVEDGLPDVQSTIRLLIRVMIAKVANERRLVEIFRTTPVVQNDPGFNCRSWVIDALSRISNDPRAVGTAELDWEKIEERARTYAAEKTAAGRFGYGQDMRKPKPTWDMLEDKEVVS
ncbi:hypothetical protein GGS26DRAFT_453945 [Hypomontagnella submonticulosa]|nr:hypothetical protein GGS26DRAFT_453945 [Hypomontagnella submonticulosa]